MSAVRTWPSTSTPWRATVYRRSGAATGKGRSRIASIRRKAAVQAPMASARESTAAAEVTLRFMSWRQPKTVSARRESRNASRRKSRHSSRVRSAGPKALRASAGSRPCSMASSMCPWISSSISRLRPSPRIEFAMRDQNDMFRPSSIRDLLPKSPPASAIPPLPTASCRPR